MDGEMHIPANPTQRKIGHGIAVSNAWRVRNANAKKTVSWTSATTSRRRINTRADDNACETVTGRNRFRSFLVVSQVLGFLLGPRLWFCVLSAVAVHHL